MTLTEVLLLIIVAQLFVIMYQLVWLKKWLVNIYEMAWALKKMVVNGIKVDDY